MSGTSGPGRLSPAEAHTEVSPPAPPVTDQRVRSALAVCQEGSFMVYTGTKGDGLLSGYLTAAQAVQRADAEGATYFGTVHPWIWIIDVDDPTCDAYRTLIAIFDNLDTEHVVVRSGRGRHLYVNMPDSDERDRIWEELLRSHPTLDPVHQIDRRPSGSIRPLLAPPKVGSEHGPAMPEIDLDEALEMFESWRRPSAPNGAALPPKLSMAALPEWAHAYLLQDWQAASKLKPPTISPRTGEPDRNWVDFEIALAYRNAGLGLTDYLAARQPGGTHPSPKASEKGPRGIKYLERQWSDAMALPARSAVSSADVVHLDAFLADVEASALKANRKRVIGALVDLCRRTGKVAVDIDERTLALEASVGRDLIRAMFHDAAVTRYVVRWHHPDNSHDRPMADVYQLQITDQHRCAVQVHPNRESVLSGSGPEVDKPSVPNRNHPVFVSAGLGPKGYETVLAYSLTPTRRSDARRSLTTPMRRQTFDTHTRRLVTMGVLVVDSNDRYSIRPDLDWNRLAHEMGAFEELDRRAERILRNRVERHVSLEHRESPQRHQDRTGVSYTPDETAAWTAELRTKLEREFTERQQRVVKSAVRWGAVDAHTGELIPYPAVQARESVVPQLAGRSPEAVPSAQRPVAVPPHAYSVTNGLCVACGLPCVPHHATGLRLHGFCRVPLWMARMYERRGQPIPPHQILPKPAPPVDPYEIDPRLDHYRRQIPGNAA